MRVGTKSLLFGVHQVLWHPLTVARAWRSRYGKWPGLYESVAIFLHDWGYWGCRNMDGDDGKIHPSLGASLTYYVITELETLAGREWWRKSSVETAMKYHSLVLFHSRTMASMLGGEPSALCNPDKDSILFDPLWFYWLRGNASGEIREYRDNAVKAGLLPAGTTTWQWLNWYHDRVKSKGSAAAHYTAT